MTIGAEQGEIAEVGSPVTVPPDMADARCPGRWTAMIVGTATLFLALANAHAAVSWLDEQAPGPLTERLRRPVARWEGAVGAAGFDLPGAMLRETWKRAQAARFADERPGDPGTR